MDLSDFLRQFVAADWVAVPAVGVALGTFIFMAIEWLDHIRTIPGTYKYWGAIGACVVIPPLAYWGLTARTHDALTDQGWFLAVCVVVAAVSYVVSQINHKLTEVPPAGLPQAHK